MFGVLSPSRQSFGGKDVFLPIVFQSFADTSGEDSVGEKYFAFASRASRESCYSFSHEKPSEGLSLLLHCVGYIISPITEQILLLTAGSMKWFVHYRFPTRQFGVLAY